MNALLRTKIVCTIGPSSRDLDMLRHLTSAGMDVARLNFSHGDEAMHAETIHRIRTVSAELNKPIAVICDLQGPKLRVGVMPSQGVPLQAGERLILTTAAVEEAELSAALGERDSPRRVPVQFERLPEVVTNGDRILIDDGLIELTVNSVGGHDILTTVVTGGLLQSNKGLNLPRAALSIPAITEKDRQDLRFALDQGVDWIAQSFVRTADEVLELKSYIRELSAFSRLTPVIAKIEKPEAIENIDAIIAASDGIMVARGDLGIEMSPEAVPMLQKAIIQKCNRMGKPVITATQMLDSMIRNPRPTRAEASDVANAILDGSDAIMLSGETAAGKYPLLAVETMVRIAREVEHAQAETPGRQIAAHPGRTFAEAVSHASVETAVDLNAAAIVAPTTSGHTARTISRFRPPCPIVAVTPSPMAQREMVLLWGVYPLLSQRAATTDAVIADAVDTARRHGFVQEGDVVVVTGGSVESGVGTTNLMKVHLVERVLARGAGLGDRKVYGKVRRLTGPLAEDVRVEPDEIIVTACTDRSFIPALRRAAGLITSDACPDSHCRLVALEMGLPAVVGVQGLESLAEGMHIVMDAKRGLAYERPAALWRTSE